MRIFLADGQDTKTETIRNSGKQEKCILGFSCFPEFLIDLLPTMNNQSETRAIYVHGPGFDERPPQRSCHPSPSSASRKLSHLIMECSTSACQSQMHAELAGRVNEQYDIRFSRKSRKGQRSEEGEHDGPGQSGRNRAGR